MKNFFVEVAVNRRSLNLDAMEGAPIIADFSTNSVLELSQYVSDAVSYFSGRVRFEHDVTYVGILVRAYKDHHVISIDRADNGDVRVRTNQ